MAFDPFHRRVQQQAVPEGPEQGAHILPGPAGDRQPLGPALHLQEAVILEEAAEVRGWKRQDPGWLRRPDRARHRQQVIVQQLAAEVPGGQEFPQGHAGVRGDERVTEAVEAQDVPEHLVERRPECVPALGEDGVEGVVPPVLQARCRRSGS